MNQPNKERFKTSVGGQALMEGIMMRGPKLICCAVRKPDGTIETKTEPTPTHGIWTKIPLVRGAISMIESLIMGYRYMMYSAQVSMGDDYDPEEEETAFEKWVGEHLGKKAEDALLACAPPRVLASIRTRSWGLVVWTEMLMGEMCILMMRSISWSCMLVMVM